MVWAFSNVDYFEDKTLRRYVGHSEGISFRVMKGVYYRIGSFQGQPISSTKTTLVDRGGLFLSNKCIYFEGSMKGFHVPYRKVASFFPFEDGIGLFRDTATAKRQMFVTGDGLFAYNLVTNLARIDAGGTSQQRSTGGLSKDAKANGALTGVRDSQGFGIKGDAEGFKWHAPNLRRLRPPLWLIVLCGLVLLSILGREPNKETPPNENVGRTGDAPADTAAQIPPRSTYSTPSFTPQLPAQSEIEPSTPQTPERSSVEEGQIAPSFSCQKPLPTIEALICEHRELANIDNEVFAAYRRLLSTLEGKAKQRLKAAQRKWLKEREQCGHLEGGTEQCMEEAYRRRLSALRNAGQ